MESYSVLCHFDTSVLINSVTILHGSVSNKICFTFFNSSVFFSLKKYYHPYLSNNQKPSILNTYANLQGRSFSLSDGGMTVRFLPSLIV